MDAFRISISNGTPCTVGLEDDGVFSTIVAWSCGSPSGRRASLGVQLIGVRSPRSEWSQWSTPELRVGSGVSVAIVEASVVDTPNMRFLAASSYPAFVMQHAGVRMRALAQRERRDPIKALRQLPGRLRKEVAGALSWAVNRSDPPVFLVSVNGTRACAATAASPGVLTVTLSRIRKANQPASFTLAVNALDSVRGEHLRWHTPPVQMGDRIDIQVLNAGEAPAPDSPIERRPSAP